MSFPDGRFAQAASSVVLCGGWTRRCGSFRNRSGCLLFTWRNICARVPASSHYNSRTNGRWIRARPSSFINIPRRVYSREQMRYAPRYCCRVSFSFYAGPRLRCQLGELLAVEAGSIAETPGIYVTYVDGRGCVIFEFRRILLKILETLKYSRPEEILKFIPIVNLSF